MAGMMVERMFADAGVMLPALATEQRINWTDYISIEPGTP